MDRPLRHPAHLCNTLTLMEKFHEDMARRVSALRDDLTAVPLNWMRQVERGQMEIEEALVRLANWIGPEEGLPRLGSD